MAFKNLRAPSKYLPSEGPNLKSDNSIWYFVSNFCIRSSVTYRVRIECAVHIRQLGSVHSTCTVCTIAHSVYIAHCTGNANSTVRHAPVQFKFLSWTNGAPRCRFLFRLCVVRHYFYKRSIWHFSTCIFYGCQIFIKCARMFTYVLLAAEFISTKSECWRVTRAE